MAGLKWLTLSPKRALDYDTYEKFKLKAPILVCTHDVIILPPWQG